MGSNAHCLRGYSRPESLCTLNPGRTGSWRRLRPFLGSSAANTSARAIAADGSSDHQVTMWLGRIGAARREVEVAARTTAKVVRWQHLGQQTSEAIATTKGL